VRTISYAQAINEALAQMLREDERVMLIGQGVTSPWYVGSTTVDLVDEYGPDRVFDTPVSEGAVTGASIGAAMAGMRPIVVHPRMDFMYYALDQIANHAGNWRYMLGGKVGAPVTIWAIINRGGEQAAQHSQALQAIFAHLPGVMVVMPSTPHDAKGLLVASVRDDDPVVFVDDRWLYDVEGNVPEELYSVPVGKAAIRREGSDITIAATSYLAHLAWNAAVRMAEDGIDAEVIDVRSLKPLDEEVMLQSVRKTGRLLVADAAWRSYGATAEIAARVSELAFKSLKSPVRRLALPDAPAPASGVLEKKYYIGENDLVLAAKELLAAES
jgi:pyruvate/2-oxoglutarate/acetoin dehydrogenase E1 component